MSSATFFKSARAGGIKSSRPSQIFLSASKRRKIAVERQDLRDSRVAMDFERSEDAIVLLEHHFPAPTRCGPLEML